MTPTPPTTQVEHAKVAAALALVVAAVLAPAILTVLGVYWWLRRRNRTKTYAATLRPFRPHEYRGSWN